MQPQRPSSATTWDRDRREVRAVQRYGFGALPDAAQMRRLDPTPAAMIASIGRDVRRLAEVPALGA
jgi:hypothetical protein